MPSIAAEVTKTARNVDTVVVDYATGYIRHLENNIGPQHDLTAEASFIASLLVGAGVEKPAAQKLYDHMLKEFTVLQKEAINEAGATAQSQIIDQQALKSAVNHASSRQSSVLNNNIFGVADRSDNVTEMGHVVDVGQSGGDEDVSLAGNGLDDVAVGLLGIKGLGQVLLSGVEGQIDLRD